MVLAAAGAGRQQACEVGALRGLGAEWDSLLEASKASERPSLAPPPGETGESPLGGLQDQGGTAREFLGI